jgi:hypothetical protein
MSSNIDCGADGEQPKGENGVCNVDVLGIKI